MSGGQNFGNDVQRKAGRVANGRQKARRMALFMAGSLLLAVPGGFAIAAEGNAQDPGMTNEGMSFMSYTNEVTQAPSMSDAQLAQTIKRLDLSLSSKPAREMVKGWHKPKKVVIFDEGSPEWIPWIKSVAPDLDYVVIPGRRGGIDYEHRGRRAPLTKEQLADIADADVQVGGSCTKTLLGQQKNLEAVISAHVGVEGCFTGEVPKRLLDGEVVVTNQKGTYGLPIGTTAIALMLALERGLDKYVRMNDAEHWTNPPPGRLRFPEGETMLVVGLGGLGTEIARLAHYGLGMKIIATRASSHEGPPFVDYVGLSNELPELAAKADVVVSAVPLTDETRNLFNANVFNHTKKGAIFINVSRGGVVDSNALVAALKSGQLGGAGLDVGGENLKKGDPLWHAPNIIIDPHNSAHFATATEWEKPGNHTIYAWAVMRENFRRFIDGDKLYSVVNPKTAY
jgi:phosphoglycerate dehydrogenase-like enzyme